MNNSIPVQEASGSFTATFIIFEAEEYYEKLLTLFSGNCFYTIRGVMSEDPAPGVDPTAVYCIINSFEGNAPDLLIHLNWMKMILNNHADLFAKIKLSGGRFEFSLFHYVFGRMGTELIFPAEYFECFNTHQIKLRVTAILHRKRPSSVVIPPL